MKAYRVMACKDDYCTVVVFAESAGKAKSYVLKYIFNGVNYCDLIANRVPLIDKYYQKNKKIMDWMNPNDRLILVKELGLRCAFYTSDIPYNFERVYDDEIEVIGNIYDNPELLEAKE